VLWRQTLPLHWFWLLPLPLLLCCLWRCYCCCCRHPLMLPLYRL